MKGGCILQALLATNEVGRETTEGAGMPCKISGTGTVVVLRGTLVKAFGRLNGGDGCRISWATVKAAATFPDIADVPRGQQYCGFRWLLTCKGDEHGM